MFALPLRLDPATGGLATHPPDSVDDVIDAVRTILAFQPRTTLLASRAFGTDDQRYRPLTETVADDLRASVIRQDPRAEILTSEQVLGEARRIRLEIGARP